MVIIGIGVASCSKIIALLSIDCISNVSVRVSRTPRLSIFDVLFTEVELDIRGSNCLVSWDLLVVI